MFLDVRQDLLQGFCGFHILLPVKCSVGQLFCRFRAVVTIQMVKQQTRIVLPECFPKTDLCADIYRIGFWLICYVHFSPGPKRLNIGGKHPDGTLQIPAAFAATVSEYVGTLPRYLHSILILDPGSVRASRQVINL